VKSRIVAVLLFAAPLWAQQPAKELTLADAEKLALQTNPRIAAARLMAAAAYEVPKEFQAGTSPAIAANVTGVGADSGSRIAAGALTNPVLYSRLATGISFSQVLTDFGRTRDLVASAKLRAQAQDQLTEMARADILLATAHAYFSVLRAREVLKVAQQTVQERQLVSDQVNALFNSQLKSQLDLSFANVNLADARLLLSQARNDEQSAEASLAAVVGLPSDTTFTVFEEAMPEPLNATVESFVQQALVDRPEIKDLRLEQSAAERFAESERSLSHPTLSVAGAAGVAPVAESKVPSSYSGIGINLNIPILNGGLFRARRSEAELKEQAAGERVNDLTVRVTRDVRVTYFNANTAFERVGLTSQLLSQAQLALDLAQGRYDLGLSSIIELSQAQLNLTSAQIANASARYEYQEQRVLIDYQIGALH
jgi:outer membrane protein